MIRFSDLLIYFRLKEVLLHVRRIGLHLLDTSRHITYEGVCGADYTVHITPFTTVYEPHR